MSEKNKKLMARIEDIENDIRDIKSYMEPSEAKKYIRDQQENLYALLAKFSPEYN